MTEEKNKREEQETGAPVCEKCGNVLIKESLDFALDGSSDSPKESDAGEWYCPHCQGEIDFLGEDDE